MVTNKDIANLSLWSEAKEAYTQSVFNFPNFEIAETFLILCSVIFMITTKLAIDIIYVLSSQLIEAPAGIQHFCAL